MRKIAKALEVIGFEPWLDENVMSAGFELERSLLSGMEESCAAVFFITPEFKDEKFLATEINYAIAERRKKEEKFRIITLIINSNPKEKLEVPGLLRPYIWKEPKSEIDILIEIIKALPIQVSSIKWRE